MGMFDNLYVHKDYPLPRLPESKTEYTREKNDDQGHYFQTKDLQFDPSLNSYTIMPDGRIMLTYRWSPEEEKRRIMEPTNYTGPMYFYDGYDVGVDHFWLEYRAQITNGQVMSIKRILYEEYNEEKTRRRLGLPWRKPSLQETEDDDE